MCSAKNIETNLISTIRMRFTISNSVKRRLILLVSIITAFACIIYIGTGNVPQRSVDAAADLFPVTMPDGRPLRFDTNRSSKPTTQIILVSTWRSGSSFVGRLLAAIPNTLYYYEPLIYLPNFLFRIQGPPHSDEAITLLRTLLQCNHSLLTVNNGLMRKGSYFLPLFNSSTNICGEKLMSCRRTEFTEALCRKSPIHVMKVVRMHLNLVESLLADNSMLPIVLYLVRDPRGTLNSRGKAQFMTNYDREPAVLCADLVSEFYAAERLHEKFPNRFKVVRYEDLAENTSNATEEILQFLGFKMHPQVVEFIKQHTQKQEKSLLSIKRNSSYTATRWTTELSWDSIAKIQDKEVCQKAMRLWGYETATNVSDQREFAP